ncbi:MAG: 2Fe-2S iron-sulfur cluster binding domain-containing protein [Fretibacterium sp.]|nr:2Fe-2S iron-sulfur cluster binding domain-containing protein [Fretibacterium sp.]
MKIELTVNGMLRSFEVGPMTRLIDLLRDDLRHTGTKEGCGEGECGACSVIMDGQLVTSCLIPAIQASGSEVLTVEGLGTSQNPDPLQTAFSEEGAIHCGFCTPGMILASHALLAKHPEPDLKTIRRELSGNICRCTGYEKIYEAVNRAAREGYGQDIKPRPNLCVQKAPSFTPEEAERYFYPATLAEALKTLQQHPGLPILAGGTDLMVDVKGGRLHLDKALAVFHLPELHELRQDDNCIHIGSCVTNDELDNSPLINELLPSLAACARQCGGPAIQNRATIGGNICTASGAGDLPVVLLALDASVILASADGEERMRLEDFVLRYRQTALKPGQLVKAILVPLPAKGSRQVFFKRGSRKALTLSRVSLAAYLELEEDKIRLLRLAAGSMSPIPRRLKETEAELIGKKLDRPLLEKAASAASREISPRKQTHYRKKITGNLVSRFFEEVLETAGK